MLEKCKKPYESVSAHIEARPNIGDDYRSCLVSLSAFPCESLELYVQVTIGLMPVSRDPCIDSDLFLLRRPFEEVRMHSPKETVDSAREVLR